MSAPRTASELRDQARARLRPGNFQGHKPRAGSHRTESEAIEALGAAEGRWFDSARKLIECRAVATTRFPGLARWQRSRD